MQETFVKELAPIVDGRGGGKPDMAMAGGSNQAKIQELLDAAKVNCKKVKIYPFG